MAPVVREEAREDLPTVSIPGNNNTDLVVRQEHEEGRPTLDSLQREVAIMDRK